MGNQSLEKTLPFSIYLEWPCALEIRALLSSAVALQSEEMLPLETISMSLGRVVRMVPFLHQLVSHVAIPHP